MFDDLKNGLSAPIAGMSVSFTSSLFGLAGSLILGFLDLQAGQAQNRFYTEFEEFLASHVQTTPVAEAVPDAPIIARAATCDRGSPRREGDGELAEGIQALVDHMRTEQQQIRDWVEAQARSRKISASSCGASYELAPDDARMRAARGLELSMALSRGRRNGRSTIGRASSTPCRRCCS